MCFIRSYLNRPISGSMSWNLCPCIYIYHILVEFSSYIYTYARNHGLLDPSLCAVVHMLGNHHINAQLPEEDMATPTKPNSKPSSMWPFGPLSIILLRRLPPGNWVAKGDWSKILARIDMEAFWSCFKLLFLSAAYFSARSNYFVHARVEWGQLFGMERSI